AAGRKRRPGGSEVSDGKWPVREGHVRNFQEVYQRRAVRRAWRGPLSAIASDACRARGGAGRIGALKSLLGQEGRCGAATAPRYGAGENLRLHGAPGYALSALSHVERYLAVALRARDRHPPAWRFPLRARPDRRADSVAAQQPVFP